MHPHPHAQPLADPDLRELAHRAGVFFDAIAAERPQAVLAHYRELGHGTAAAERLLDEVHRHLAVAGACQSMGLDASPAMAGPAHRDGLHGYLAQTRDYARTAQRMGVFVDHDCREPTLPGLANRVLPT